MNIKISLLISITLYMVMVVGCQKPPVRTYSVVAPLSPAQQIHQNFADLKPKGLPYKWDLPKKWEIGKVSSMRLASFKVIEKIQDKDSLGEISVVVLGQGAGGLVANVNRWRTQVGLSPQSSKLVHQESSEGKSKLGDFTWVKIINPENPEIGILASIFFLDNETLFIKLVAPSLLIESQQKDFLKFCKSIQRNHD
jgi:hypothetical protein